PPWGLTPACCDRASSCRETRPRRWGSAAGAPRRPFRARPKARKRPDRAQAPLLCPPRLVAPAPSAGLAVAALGALPRAFPVAAELELRGVAKASGHAALGKMFSLIGLYRHTPCRKRRDAHKE